MGNDAEGRAAIKLFGKFERELAQVTLRLFAALPLFAASPAQPRFFGAKSHADDEQTGD
jgi:hypothetical protein